jgi:hypothetical protein
VLGSLSKVATPEEHAQRRRENGKKSRGPKTEEGRLATDLSKVRHGVRCERPVIPKMESPLEWETHLDAFIESLSPSGSVEYMIAYRIALNYWRLGRLTRAEIAAVSTEIEEDPFSSDGKAALSKHFLPYADTLDRLIDYERHLCGMIRRDFNQLERFQALRTGRPVAAPIEVGVTLSSGAEPEIG